MSAGKNPRTITLPGQRLRAWAKVLLDLHPLHSADTLSNNVSGSATAEPSEETSNPTITTKSTIKVVCISDTHNTQPELPPADVLIHAGDLTGNGSFDEVQAQLHWLSAQPHRYKIAIAGNHDVLLDDAFLEQHPERRYGETRKTRHDLDWGSVLYLKDSSVKLEFPAETASPEESINDETLLRQHQQDQHKRKYNQLPQYIRTLTIYGSPRTPQYGVSAFQYPPEEAEAFWASRIPFDVDVVVVHGPLRLHLDTSGVRHAGCPFLAREIGRVRP
jgi:hypothetical protein